MEPSQLPLQVASFTRAETLMGCGASMEKLTVVSQPAASEIVSVPAPGHRPLTPGEPCPLAGGGAHVYVYSGVPPLATACALPSQTDGQLAWVNVRNTSKAGGAVMLYVRTFWQPCESVTVTVQVPAQSCEAVAVPWPCGGAGDHT